MNDTLSQMKKAIKMYNRFRPYDTVRSYGITPFAFRSSSRLPSFSFTLHVANLIPAQPLNQKRSEASFVPVASRCRESSLCTIYRVLYLLSGKVDRINVRNPIQKRKCPCTFFNAVNEICLVYNSDEIKTSYLIKIKNIKFAFYQI